MDEKQQNMINKIAGLLATAESFSADGNEEAASSYVQKAHALQQKYSIDLAMVAAHEGTKVEKIISRWILTPNPYGRRKTVLAHTVATHSGCTGYFSKRHYDAETKTSGYAYHCFGFESDVNYVEFLTKSLMRQCDAAMKAAKKRKPSYEHGKTFGVGFMEGYITEINARLLIIALQMRKEAQQVEDEKATPGSSSVALVLASKADQVKQEMTASVGSLRKTKLTVSDSYSGHRAGSEAGRNATMAKADVGTGVKASLGS